MELAFEDRHLDLSKRDFSDLDLYERMCSLCGFEFTDEDEDEDEDEIVKWEKAVEPGIDKCHGRRSYPIALHHECVEYAKTFVSGNLRDLAGAAVTIRGSFNEPQEMLDDYPSKSVEVLGPTVFANSQSDSSISNGQGRPRRGFISVPIHIHTTLWVQYTHFEGIRYVLSLSYDSQGGDEELLFKGDTEKPLNVFVRHNHLGVNKLVITEGQERPESEEAYEYWWTCHAQQTRPFHFKARFDYPGRKDTLIIVTDRGRSFVLGTQQDGPGAMYHVIAKLPQGKPCFMFYAHCHILSWFHFDSVLGWERPQTRQFQPAWKTASDMTIGTHYSSAKLDGVTDITPCIKTGSFTWGQNEIIQGLLLTYYDGTRTCIGEVRCDDLGTPQRVTSDTLWIRYVEHKEAGILDENIHCCDCGIEWFGFSQPQLGPFSSDKDMDDPTDEQDSDEEQTSHQDNSSAEDESEDENESQDENESDDGYDRSPKYVSLPMRGRLDWVKESDGCICLLSHHMRSRLDDEMLHVLAEDAKIDREEPVSKPCTFLTGRTSESKTVGLDHKSSWHANLSHQPAPENFRDEKWVTGKFDNYAIYGL
ncbi:hypothetical protein FPCIR_716 [Fusarium pseudocircinatum]|uniref:Uncharacterized protein n=1 Tax=Fusarium pseudocircinatum TaxID=56676 RepID=A0A8H5V0G2_9HYPO|nr:hypothetical protein FPCIR_716 [Fusarium pseudocircinatum]